MTGFFEIFNPGNRYWREQRDFDKIAVVPTRKGGRGPLQIDLDGGTVNLPTDGSEAFVRPVADPTSTRKDAATRTSAAAQVGGGFGGPVVHVSEAVAKATAAAKPAPATVESAPKKRRLGRRKG